MSATKNHIIKHNSVAFDRLTRIANHTALSFESVIKQALTGMEDAIIDDMETIEEVQDYLKSSRLNNGTA